MVVLGIILVVGLVMWLKFCCNPSMILSSGGIVAARRTGVAGTAAAPAANTSFVIAAPFYAPAASTAPTGRVNDAFTGVDLEPPPSYEDAIKLPPLFIRSTHN